MMIRKNGHMKDASYIVIGVLVAADDGAQEKKVGGKGGYFGCTWHLVQYCDIKEQKDFGFRKCRRGMRIRGFCRTRVFFTIINPLQRCRYSTLCPWKDRVVMMKGLT